MPARQFRPSRNQPCRSCARREGVFRPDRGKQLADDDPYKLIDDLLYEDYHDEDFADLYHKEGKPALSPSLLSAATSWAMVSPSTAAALPT